MESLASRISFKSTGGKDGGVTQKALNENNKATMQKKNKKGRNKFKLAYEHTLLSSKVMIRILTS
jgi:hypothetical protein